METEPTQRGQGLPGSDCSAGGDLRATLNALSPAAKAWLEKTCERFAESEGYDKRDAEIAECVAAGLVRKRSFYVEIHEDVMGLVYSEGFFRQSLILRSPDDLPEYDGEILVALWGANELEIVSVRENVGGPFTAEYKNTNEPADPSEWQWWADLRHLSLPSD